MAIIWLRAVGLDNFHLNKLKYMPSDTLKTKPLSSVMIKEHVIFKFVWGKRSINSSVKYLRISFSNMHKLFYLRKTGQEAAGNEDNEDEGKNVGTSLHQN